MRTVTIAELIEENCDFDCGHVLKTDVPFTVLKVVDRQIESSGLEVVIIETPITAGEVNFLIGKR